MRCDPAPFYVIPVFWVGFFFSFPRSLRQKPNFSTNSASTVGSVVGIVTRYGLDGPGLESW